MKVPELSFDLVNCIIFKLLFLPVAKPTGLQVVIFFYHQPFGPGVPVGRCTAIRPWEIWLWKPLDLLVTSAHLKMTTSGCYSSKIGHFGL